MTDKKAFDRQAQRQCVDHILEGIKGAEVHIAIWQEILGLKVSSLTAQRATCEHSEPDKNGKCAYCTAILDPEKLLPPHT